MWACPRRSANVVRNSTGLHVVCRVRARRVAPVGFAPYRNRRSRRRAVRGGWRLRPERCAAPPGSSTQESALAPRSLLAVDVVVFELLVERRAIDLEDRGGLGLVAVGRGERGQDAF